MDSCLTLPVAEIQAIIQQAEACFPDECCGVILTRGPERLRVPVANVQGARHRADPVAYPDDAGRAFTMDPRDLRIVDGLVRWHGWTLAVIYHSHVNDPPGFSEQDAAHAVAREFPAAAYLIVSLVVTADEARVTAAAYRWSPQGFASIPLTFTGDPR